MAAPNRSSGPADRPPAAGPTPPAPTPLRPTSPLRPRVPDRWFPARVFGTWWAAVTVATAAGIASLGSYRVHRISPHATTSGFLGWLQGWCWWDGAWYVGIIRDGYYFRPGRMSSVAFFPAYPVVGGALTAVFRDPLLALVVLSTVSGLVAVVLFHRWCLRWLDPFEARCAVAALVAYPCAFYLMGIAYADGMFLAASLAAFVLLERRRPLAAGALAALATATRPLGLAVVVGLWLRSRELRDSGPAGSEGGSGDRWRARAGLLLAPLGLLGYCAYLWVRFDRPLAFIDAQAGWKQPPGPATWAKVSWFRSMAKAPFLGPGQLHLLGNAAIAIVALCLLPRVFRRFGRAYGVYSSILVVGAALSTKDFIGMARYVLPAFPLFAVVGAGAAAHSASIRRKAVVVSGCLLVVLSFVHARGTLVS